MHCDHEYLTFKGRKFSKSQGAAVDVPYFLSKHGPDPPRFYLTATAPETRDHRGAPGTWAPSGLLTGRLPAYAALEEVE